MLLSLCIPFWNLSLSANLDLCRYLIHYLYIKKKLNSKQESRRLGFTDTQCWPVPHWQLELTHVCTTG